MRNPLLPHRSIYIVRVPVPSEKVVLGPTHRSLDDFLASRYSSEECSIRTAFGSFGGMRARSKNPLSAGSAKALREACRRGEHVKPTSGLAPGYVQCNVVILPAEHALHFLIFALRNPRACPLLGVTSPGRANDFENLAQGSDIRTDIPRYAVFEKGQLIDKPDNIRHLWNDEMVAFLGETRRTKASK